MRIIWHKFINQVRCFLNAHNGGVLVFLALCAIPLILTLGLSVDSSYGLLQKTKLRMATDAAAKAGLANGNGVTATIISEAQKVFAVNVGGMTGISGPNVSVDNNGKSVTVSASIIVPNTFMVFGGIPNSSYNASSTATNNNNNMTELAIVYEVSARFSSNNFHRNICNALINFVNSLPDNVMVSITPIATEILLDPSTTNVGALYNNLSSTANDEAAFPALFPLSSSLTWNLTNYNSVANLFYATGPYATLPTDKNVLMSFPSPSTCINPTPNYPSCAPITWPIVCPGTHNTSCSQVYSYIANNSFPILPLTLNKSLIVNYLTNLASFTTTTDGSFSSLISWGWRTIDPNWSNFWMTNSDPKNTSRTIGQYPNPYGTGFKKNMIIILNNTSYWDSYTSNLGAYYSNKCGNSNTVVNGLNHWWLTSYGMIPVPKDLQSNVIDITCENRWYNPMDVSLGLNLSNNAYSTSLPSNAYLPQILNTIDSKFQRICTNIKATNINVYMLSTANGGPLQNCSNSKSNTFTITNSNSSISNALNQIQTQITTNSS